MSDKISHLNVVSVDQKVNESTIRILEGILAEARSGEVVEVFIIGKGPGGWRELASPTTGFCEWIGRLEIQKASWIKHFFEHEENEG